MITLVRQLTLTALLIGMPFKISIPVMKMLTVHMCYLKQAAQLTLSQQHFVNSLRLGNDPEQQRTSPIVVQHIKQLLILFNHDTPVVNTMRVSTLL